MAATRLSPIAKDAVFFVASLAVLLIGVWIAVVFGVSFAPGGGGIALWAVALLVIVGGIFAAANVWWYYVYPDERAPARGEFTFEPREGRRMPGVRGGMGTFRDKALREGAMRETGTRMSDEPGFVPRTARGWVLWMVAMVAALLAASALVLYSRTVEDPLSPLLVAVGLLGAAVMLGAVAVGEMGHQRGAYFRHRERGGDRGRET